MKLLIPLAGLSAIYAGTDSGAISSNSQDDNEVTEVKQDGRRISYEYRTMMSAMLAERYPRLAGQANLHKWVNRVLRNYGCNCFVRVTGDGQKGLNMCRVNGAPHDAMDTICNKYARMYKCMERETSDFDFGGGWIENQFKEPGMEPLNDGSRPGRWNVKCGAHTAFEWHMINGEAVCGPVSDPNYEMGIDQGEKACEATACETAKQLIGELIDADDQWEYPEAFFRANTAAGKYNMHNDESQCPTNGKITNECCGDYPTFYSYGMVTPYNSENHDCCYGDVVELGTCA